MRSLFSVLVPIYNVENYLDRCIKSILNQTEQDFEVIAVNDGSTDSSGEIIDNFAKKDSRIKVIHKENQGLLLARSTGIENTTGKYIVFLDSDDYLELDALESIKKTIKSTNADLIIYKYYSVDEKGNKKESLDIFKDGYIINENNKEELYKIVISSMHLNSLCTKAIKREVLLKDETNYEVYKNVSNGEDILRLLSLFTYSEKIVFLNKPLINYIYNANSISRKFNKKMISSIFSVIKVLKEYIYKWNLEKMLNNFYKRVIENVFNIIGSLFLADNIKNKEKYYILKEIINKELCVEAFQNASSSDRNYMYKFQLYLIKNKRIYTLFIFYLVAYNLKTFFDFLFRFRKKH